LQLGDRRRPAGVSFRQSVSASPKVADPRVVLSAQKPPSAVSPAPQAALGAKSAASLPSSLSALRLATRAVEVTLSGGSPLPTVSWSAGPLPLLVGLGAGPARLATGEVALAAALFALPTRTGSPALARPNETGPSSSPARMARPSA